MILLCKESTTVFMLFPSLPVSRNSNNSFAKVETYSTISKILKTQVLILQLIQVLESCVAIMGLETIFIEAVSYTQ